MDINKLPKTNPDGSPVKTLKNIQDDIEAGRPLDPNVTKTLENISANARGMDAVIKTLQTPIIQRIKLIDVPLSRVDLIDILNTERKKSRTVTYVTLGIAIIAVIVAILAWVLPRTPQ